MSILVVQLIKKIHYVICFILFCLLYGISFLFINIMCYIEKKLNMMMKIKLSYTKMQLNQKHISKSSCFCL